MESGVGVEKDYRNQQPDNGSVLYGAEGSIQASKGRDEQQRWSAKGKMEVVLRILRGEPVDGLSRELRVAVPDLVRWRDDFLAGGLANLKARPAGPTEEQLRQAQAKIGDLAMRLELGRRAHPKRGLCWQAEAVWAMSREASPSTNKRYPLGMVCQVWRFSKATCYRHQGVEAPLAGQEEEKAKRGPKPAISDEELLEAIRQVLAEAPFYGEGYRKVRGQATLSRARGRQEPGVAPDAATRVTGTGEVGT